MFKYSNFVFGSLLAVALLFSAGCKQDAEIISDIKVTDSQVLKELQFMKDEKMISTGTYEKLIRRTDIPMIVDAEKGMSGEHYPTCYDEDNCDELDSRALIQQMIKEKEASAGFKARHRRHTNMYQKTGGTIVLRVKQAGSTGVPVANQVPAVWLTALNNAVAAWNALPNCKVKFSVICAANNTNPSGYVNIYYSNLGANLTIADAELPQTTNGFGSYLRINSGYNGTSLIADAKKLNMAHELGHIIGLRHTDTQNGNDVASTIACGNPASTNYTDPQSIMRSSISPFDLWMPGFTTCDKTVIAYYWNWVVV